MEITQYRDCIVVPIEGESAIGHRLIDDSLFDFIEDQMMKVGSLSHASVQWDEVEHSALKLLKEKSKDLKLVVYLLQCLHNRLSTERFITSVWVLADFMSHYWEECYPAPGKRGALPRRKFFSQIIQRFSAASEKVDFNLFDAQAVDELMGALDKLDQSVSSLGLGSDAVEITIVKIKGELKRAQERKQQEQKAVIPNSSSSVASNTIEPAPVAIDNSSEKSSKQTLLKVADFLFEQDAGQELSLRVRRYAVWSSVTSAPDHSPSGETLLRSMSQERIKEYQDQMRSPDLALWRKVENSLAISPFWFEGQLMSYRIAEYLGKPAWCEAIWSETHKFIDRLPSLIDLKFKDGEPFVSEDVKQWLQAGPASNSSSSQTVSGDWNEKREEAFTLAKEGGIAVALSMLNDGLVSATEPRDRFYWRLLSADLLKANSLDAMAQEHYQTLHKQIKAMAVTDWEPSLVEQLENFTTSVKSKD
ncbi:type VI secretion system protein TssA [Vibrio paucivorans]